MCSTKFGAIQVGDVASVINNRKLLKVLVINVGKLFYFERKGGIHVLL